MTHPLVPRGWRRLLTLLILLSAIPINPGRADDIQPGTTSSWVFLPVVANPTILQPFGFDLRQWWPQTMDLAINALPSWARVSDFVWHDLEPVRGGGYRWEVLARRDEQIRQLRAAGIEPVVVVQYTPAWAQLYPGHACSPPAPQYLPDYARLMEALARRYTGDLEVRFWEIWNEPDVYRGDTTDDIGIGCFAEPAQPDRGGRYYGQVVRTASGAIKRGNPRAQVIAGAMLYDVPDAPLARPFLNAFLAEAKHDFDILSYHAYGEFANGDLVQKAIWIRETLAAHGIPEKPLMATEVGTYCSGPCPPDFHDTQANFAGRVYAQARALNLYGALWFTLASSSPGFNESHIVDIGASGEVLPRKAYYAFRNSASLLRGVTYSGPPLPMPTADQRNQVQVLRFERGDQRSQLYVLFVPAPDTNVPVIYNVPVPTGAQAICTTQIQRDEPSRFRCSDSDLDGEIPIAVYKLPVYVDVFR